MCAETIAVACVSQISRYVEESNLTELQRLYWIGHRLRPFATHFNNAFSFTFTTPLCPELFTEAFATAVSQYDALRTIIQEPHGMPQQVVLLEPPASLACVDLSHEPDPAAAAERWQATRVQRPFTLDRCLYDSALLKLADSHFVWFLNQHHLITDASSFFLIAESLLTHYDSLRQGRPLVPAAKPTFDRYAASLQRQQASDRAAKSHAFWQEKVAQKPEPLRFYGRSSTKTSSQITRWTHPLDPQQTARLIAVADRADLGTATAEFRQFCLTAALFFGLMHQLTGSSRLGFVTTIHNRATQVNRQTAGVLMELCPVMVSLEPGETFASLMQKVAAEMKLLLLHYRHGASQAASDLALDVMFTFVQRPLLTFDNQLVAHHIVHPGTGSERLGLHVHHLAASGSYQLYLDFHQDLFTPAEQDHAWQTLQKLLTVVTQNPNAAISDCATEWPQSSEAALIEAGGNGRSRPAYAPPTTPTETALQQVWQEVLGCAAIGIHDDFFALGGESWQAMSFLSKFEAATGQYLPLSALLTASTIAGLAQQIEQADPQETIIEIQPGSPGFPRLFLIPGAAGNTLAMNRLAQHLPANQPVYTFQVPPLENDNLPPAEVELLAKYYLAAIQSVQPYGPYHLGGYSAGGILAYEVAQQLLAQNEAVPFLAILDMPAPNPAWTVWRRLCRMGCSLLRLSASQEEAIYLFGRDWWNRATFFRVVGWRRWLRALGQRLHRIGQLPLRQKLARLGYKLRLVPAAWLTPLSPSPPAIPEPSRPVLRDMDPSSLTDPRARTLFDLYDRAARSYLPAPYTGRVTLLRCPLGYGRKEIRSPYPHYGWQKLAQQLDIHVINAYGHLALLQEPAVAEVGQKLQNALSQVIEKENG
jgi:thioesterase domain-containing protein